MSVKLVYFAWVREKIGKEEEFIELPAEAVSVGELIARLKARGEEYDAAFEHENVIRAAINQEHAEHDELVKDGDEVALFPPMTGG
ncbi:MULTISPECIES: molybdopterin converting factor subunit 1 [unclassified Brucella]|uniref:molybdopterin converting factor subunit 1 n=1 Tax=unclassified Brucella TaxID=2632610 RepID=UPI0012AD6ED5|nr:MULTISPECIES: molybdopterin converting factor subunit 1 [unclassified Brucella]MRN42532.1 molybdopterin converting factor subunit 1 [Brucella sp. 09RB8913]MRN59843.1 molybdopterin converting factor subunit 1 [Brucella sp. 09RB8918]QTN98555.1 molybdopterin converting factor subunit 1 [Brucella sp. 458]CAB4325898.1 molybdopterin converting factor subunit 1 [Brucella sp. 191011898]